MPPLASTVQRIARMTSLGDGLHCDKSSLHAVGLTTTATRTVGDLGESANVSVRTPANCIGRGPLTFSP